MRYFYDTEFIEDGLSIDLISIGIVAEDGRELYRQYIGFNPRMANMWVQENVFPHLVLCPNGRDSLSSDMRIHYKGQCVDQQRGLIHNCPWRNHVQMRQDILAFMGIEKYGKPQLWGYYSAYDHVAFCQIFGTMMDLPKGFPMYTRDLKQWCDAMGNPKLPEQGKGEHNALADARWNKVAWEFLDGHCILPGYKG